MKTTNILLIIAIVIGTFNVIWVIPYVHRNFDIDSFSTLFNNFITPLATIAAFVVYFLTLNHIKQQSNSLKEQNQLIVGEKEFDAINDSLTKFIAKNKRIEFYEHFKKSGVPRTGLSFIDMDFKSIITEVVNNADYKRFKEKEITKEDYIKSNNYGLYKLVNSIYGGLKSFMYDIEFTLDKIEKSNQLHDSHKRRLVIRICSEILKEYLNFAGEKLGYDVILLTQNEGQNTYFEALEICRLFDRIKNDYNEIFFENYSLI